MNSLTLFIPTLWHCVSQDINREKLVPASDPKIDQPELEPEETSRDPSDSDSVIVEVAVGERLRGVEFNFRA